MRTVGWHGAWVGTEARTRRSTKQCALRDMAVDGMEGMAPIHDAPFRYCVNATRSPSGAKKLLTGLTTFHPQNTSFRIDDARAVRERPTMVPLSRTLRVGTPPAQTIFLRTEQRQWLRGRDQ